MADSIQYYVVLKMTPGLADAYFNPEQGNRLTAEYIGREILKSDPSVADEFKVVARPSAPHPGLQDDDKKSEPPTNEVVATLTIRNEARQHVLDRFRKAFAEEAHLIKGGGADLPFFDAEHWCPSDALDPIFDDRWAAERLIGTDFLRDKKKLTGRGVNVVVVDQGVSKDRIENWLGGKYGSGWNVGSVPHGKIASKHGMMIARNVLRSAPRATIFDLPVLPERIGDVATYLSSAHAAYLKMLSGIAAFKNENKFPGSWIVVNAWAIFDRRSDLPPPDDYSNNLRHAFNKLLAEEVTNANIDVVFCAGNCGQFCPDQRCGPGDRGPADSIFGANSHPDVLTLGAVRADTMWLGYSSQGPGQPQLATKKPDLCASSQFREADDAGMVNTGTSAACAMAAGVLAGLRSKRGSDSVSPAEMRSVLTYTARKTDSRSWNERTGSGILDAKSAFHELLKRFP